MERFCEGCGDALPPSRGRPRRFCSKACYPWLAPPNVSFAEVEPHLIALLWEHGAEYVRVEDGRINAGLVLHTISEGAHPVTNLARSYATRYEVGEDVAARLIHRLMKRPDKVDGDTYDRFLTLRRSLMRTG